MGVYDQVMFGSLFEELQKIAALDPTADPRLFNYMRSQGATSVRDLSVSQLKELMGPGGAGLSQTSLNLVSPPPTKTQVTKAAIPPQSVPAPAARPQVARPAPVKAGFFKNLRSAVTKTPLRKGLMLGGAGLAAAGAGAALGGSFSR